MMEEDIVREAIEEGTFGALEARIVASWWHGGQWSSLYSFASTGAVDDHLIDEIDKERKSCDPTELGPLASLLGFVEMVGERGPVLGWFNLHW